MRTLRGSNASAVLAKIVPIVRGWATYYRGVVSTEIWVFKVDRGWCLSALPCW
jgi:RNA-directed DNA polymerase